MLLTLTDVVPLLRVVLSDFMQHKSVWPLGHTPHAGSGVVRIDPLHFLAGCHKR